MARMEEPLLLSRASPPNLQRVANHANEVGGTSCSQCLQLNQAVLPVIAVSTAFSGI